MADKFIGAFIELIPNEENEGIDFRFGWEFPYLWSLKFKKHLRT